MVKTTSAERMRKLREKKEKDIFGIQSHHEKEGVFKANEIRRRKDKNRSTSSTTD